MDMNGIYLIIKNELWTPEYVLSSERLGTLSEKLPEKHSTSSQLFKHYPSCAAISES